MTTRRESILHENLEAFCSTYAEVVPGGTVRTFGSITGVVSGVSAGFSNRLLLFEVPTKEELASAITWMESHEVPFWITCSDDAVRSVSNTASTVGLTGIAVTPGMIHQSVGDVDAGSTGVTTPVTIDGVQHLDDRSDFTRVMADVFVVSRADMRALTPASILEREDVTLFVGRVDSRPVACGQLTRHDDIAGVYHVGVLPEYRRQGIGDAMTRELLRWGHEAGCETGVLQASEQGYPLYEQLGFERVVDYHHFASGPA